MRPGRKEASPFSLAAGDPVVVTPNCRATRHIGKKGTVVTLGRQIEVLLSQTNEVVKLNRNELCAELASPAHGTVATRSTLDDDAPPKTPPTPTEPQPLTPLSRAIGPQSPRHAASPRDERELEYQLAEDGIDYISQLASSATQERLTRTGSAGSGDSFSKNLCEPMERSGLFTRSPGRC
jgi:hypothetical protein